MLSDIYNQKILEYAGNVPRLGRIVAPHGTAKAHSRLCGSTVIVDVMLADGRIVDYRHDVKACALGQAAASIMARHVLGTTPADLRQLHERMRAMLKENGPPPEGVWAEAAVLEPVRDYKARHASTLLAFEAAAQAASAAEASAAEARAAEALPADHAHPAG